jgi:hypothetical protein
MSEMRNILKDLMQENQTLRNLLRGVSGFIGDGAGGLLPKLGWDMADFTNYVNRSETDTAWESYQLRKTVASASGPGTGQKRPAADDPNGHAKKARSSSDQDKDAERDGFSLPVGGTVPPISANSIFSGSTELPGESGSLFGNLMRASTGEHLFVQPSPPSTAPPGVSSFPPNYAAMPANLNVETSVSPAQFSPSSSSSTVPAQRTAEDQTENEEDSKGSEAIKLIHYHLDNYNINNSYCLPASLRPTNTQRSVGHESVIDRIVHPDLRDRMILMRGRFDLVDCLLDYRQAVTIHGDDVLAHSNWEISESWLRKYGYLIDQSTLDVSNRWRRERGEPEIRLADLAPEHGASV